MAFHFVPNAVESGFSPRTAASAFGLLSAMNTIGVLVVGPLADKWGNKNLLGYVYAFRALGYASLLLLPGQWGLWTFAVVGGASWIATVPLTTALTADVYGLKKVGTLMGMVFLSHQIGGSIGIQFGGIMRDITGSYDIPFAIAGILLVMASITSFVIQERKYSVRYQPANLAPTSVDS
jgi:MFS family permease